MSEILPNHFLIDMFVYLATQPIGNLFHKQPHRIHNNVLLAICISKTISSKEKIVFPSEQLRFLRECTYFPCNILKINPFSAQLQLVRVI